jgi:hypothetical protein
MTASRRFARATMPKPPKASRLSPPTERVGVRAWAASERAFLEHLRDGLVRVLEQRGPDDLRSLEELVREHSPELLPDLRRWRMLYTSREAAS